ncbi:MAG: hypothetical protein ABI680_13235 [Chthoniobacteraceae bacterium]
MPEGARIVVENQHIFGVAHESAVPLIFSQPVIETIEDKVSPELAGQSGVG